MEPIAVIFENTQVYWCHIVFVLAVLAWFFASLAFLSRAGVRAVTVILLPILAGAFSLFLSRLIYWYSAIERYPDLRTAFLDISPYAFNITGVIIGEALAILLIRATQLEKKLSGMLDAMAPPTALGAGLLYTVCIWSDTCRSNHNFLTFEGISIGMGVIFVITSLIFFIRKEKDGTCASVVILCFASCLFILDSTRYDSGFFPFNGFVSIVQIFSGICILGVTLYLFFNKLKKAGFRTVNLILLILELIAMSVSGYLEYLVQRHGDRASTIYFWMALSCVLMILLPCGIKIPKERSNENEEKKYLKRTS